MFLCCCRDDNETSGKEVLFDRFVDPGVIVEPQNREDPKKTGIEGETSKVQEPKEPCISGQIQACKEQPSGEVKAPAVEDTKNSAPPLPVSRRRIVEVLKSSDAEALGMTLDSCDGASLVVESIYPECRMANHNAENQANPSQLISIGDRITALNGITGNISLILGRFRTDTRLKLEVETPKVIEMSSPVSAKSHGLDLGVDKRKKTIYVKSIGEGCVKDWCANHGQEISRGDRIVEVNGIAGSAEAVRDEIQTLGQQAARVVIWHYT